MGEYRSIMKATDGLTGCADFEEMQVPVGGHRIATFTDE